MGRYLSNAPGDTSVELEAELSCPIFGVMGAVLRSLDVSVWPRGVGKRTTSLKLPPALARVVLTERP